MAELALLRLDEPPKPSVGDLTDEKQGKYIGIITNNFKLQANPSSCETTCITNMIHELADRFGEPNMHISESRINKACGYKHPRGYNPVKVKPGLRRELRPFGWTVDETTSTSHNSLHKVLVNKDCSYPLVGLSFEYSKDELDYRGENDTDHVVIVFRSAGDWTVVYDPYKRLSPKARTNYQAYGNGIIPVRTTKFINYWKQASVQSGWMLWASRLRKALTLETYTKTEKVVVKA